MSKNIFDKAGKENLVLRINNLQPSAAALWGKMNVIEMMHHCSLALQVIMHAEQNEKSSTLQQHFLRILFMNIIRRFPKSARAPKTLDIKKSNITVEDFEKEKNKLLKLIDVFVMQQNIFAVHPYFGKLSFRQWGKLSWMHTNHHLEQFGV